MSKDKPDFIIIGSMKSGTSSLYSDLSSHPMLCLPSCNKEPWILANNLSLQDIKESYKKHFSGAGDDQLCGEASTVYTQMPMYEGIVSRAKELCGNDLKLIMIMRDPIERIYSHLRHDVAGKHIARRGFENINKAVIEDVRYVSVSDYAMQLKPWIEAFCIENLFCISFDEYIKNRQQVVSDVIDFLGLDNKGFSLDTGKISNKSSELYYTGKYMRKITESSLYLTIIRSLLSDNLRGALKNIFLEKSVVPEILLSEDVENKLKMSLKHVESDVEELIGKRIKINVSKY